MGDLAQFARDLTNRGLLDPAGIMALRRAVYGSGLVSRDDAAVLFSIERSRVAHDDAWSALFVEALTDYAINQEAPTGYLADDCARWLMDEINKHKRPSTDAEIELLINIVEKSTEVPAAFSAFALGLVKNMVMYGGGPDARGRPHDGGRVSAADVDSLQRILWGAGTEGLLAISRDEAEALFSIAHASAGFDNDPRFDQLFARAVGNYLLGATGRRLAPRATALRWQTEDNTVDATRILRSMMTHAASADWSKLRERRQWTEPLRDLVKDPLGRVTDADRAFAAQNAQRDADMAMAEIMTPEKAGWLQEHVGLNGVMTEPEKMLMRFIESNASKIDGSLTPLLSRAQG